MYVCMYVCLYVCMYLCLYVCMFICMLYDVCIYVCMYVRNMLHRRSGSGIKISRGYESNHFKNVEIRLLINIYAIIWPSILPYSDDNL